MNANISYNNSYGHIMNPVRNRPTQSFITSYLDKGKNSKKTTSSRSNQRKNDEISDSSDIDNIDELFEKHQVDIAQNSEISDLSEHEIIVNESDDLDEDGKNDNDIEPISPEEELLEAIRDPSKRKSFIHKYYKFQEYKGNNSYYKCKSMKFEDGKVFHCDYKNRLSRLDLEHEHIWKLLGDKQDLTKEQITSVNDYDMMLTKIMLFAGHYNLSFSVIESSIFWDLLKFVFQFGQKQNSVKPDLIIKKPSHSTLRNCFIQTAQNYHESQLIAFSNINSAALTLDGGSLQCGHFIDYAISSPYYNIKPYLYHSDFFALNTSDYIRNETEKVITELFEKGIHIKTITGDNYPSQLYALSNWSESSLWRITTNPDVKKVIYFSCFCHLIQLVAEDIQNHLAIKECQKCLQNMKSLINKKYSKTVGKVPDEVECRWFSHYNSLKYILSHINEISSARDATLHRLKDIRNSSSESEKEELMSTLNDESFDLLYKYSKVMLPIYSSTLFFEQNISKAAEIVPIVQQIETYWQKLLENEDFEQFYDVIQILKKRLCHRKFHLLDWPIVNLAYSLTPGGRIYARKILKKNGYEIHDDKYDNMKGFDPLLLFELRKLQYKIKLKKINYDKDDPIETNYENITRSENTFLPDQFDIDQNSIKETTKTKESQKNLVFMVGEVKPYFEFNAERSIDGEKLNPFERKMNDLEFQYEPCHYNLLKSTLEELCLRFGYKNEKEGIIQCFDYWIKAQVNELEITNYSKDNIIKIWNDVSLYNPSWKKLSEIAIALLSAQGSETICERKISQQRLSITNRRLSSKVDLIEARFRLSCNKPPESGTVKSLNDLSHRKNDQKRIKQKELTQTILKQYKSD